MRYSRYAGTLALVAVLSGAPAYAQTPSLPPASTSPAPLDPRPAEPKTGLAIGVGLAVAALSFGGAVTLFVRGRRG